MRFFLILSRKNNYYVSVFNPNYIIDLLLHNSVLMIYTSSTKQIIMITNQLNPAQIQSYLLKPKLYHRYLLQF